jgi:hypothetical protein
MVCIVESCKNNANAARGLCSKHYSRIYRHGDVNLVKQNKNQAEFCMLENCNNKTLSRNLCSSHYARWKRNKEGFDKSPIKKVLKYTGAEICIIPFCKKEAKIKMLCVSHYQHQARHEIQFSDILNDFESGCVTCGSIKNLSLDHDHAICSGKSVCKDCYRGILCRDCNIALGQIKEKPQTLLNLAKYITERSKIY